MGSLRSWLGRSCSWEHRHLLPSLLLKLFNGLGQGTGGLPPRGGIFLGLGSSLNDRPDNCNHYDEKEFHYYFLLSLSGPLVTLPMDSRIWVSAMMFCIL